MKLVKLERNDASDAAMCLRLLARKIESGSISYCVVYAMDKSGQVEEAVFSRLATGLSCQSTGGIR